MTLEEGLYSYLQSQTGVTALVGTRIYPLLLQQVETLPAVAYQRISTQRNSSHGGPAKASIARIQFDALAATMTQAQAVLAAIRNACDGVGGTLGGGVVVSTMQADDEQTFYDEETRYKRATLDLVVYFYE